jgi:hypothetical protein
MAKVGERFEWANVGRRHWGDLLMVGMVPFSAGGG